VPGKDIDLHGGSMAGNGSGGYFGDGGPAINAQPLVQAGGGSPCVPCREAFRDGETSKIPSCNPAADCVGHLVVRLT